MSELITCIIPTYNRAALLEQAIASTCRQTHPNWELIIVDDHSTDQTAELARQWAARDERIRYFLNPGKGPGAARNHGIREARGSYIAFLDDDDESLPHRFEAQLRAMKNGGHGFLVSGFRSVERESGRVLGDCKLELRALGAGFPSRWMLKKELLEKTGGFDEALPSMEDPELSYRIAEYELFALHDDIVSIMYMHPASLSRKKVKNAQGRSLLLQKNESKMPSLEAAWWYYTLGMEYYDLGEDSLAVDSFRKAARRDSRGIYQLVFQYFNLSRRFGNRLKGFNLKVLGRFSDYRFPVLVKHPVVS